MFLVQIIESNNDHVILRDFAIITENPLEDIRSITGCKGSHNLDYFQCSFEYALHNKPEDLDFTSLEGGWGLEDGIEKLAELGSGYRLYGCWEMTDYVTCEIRCSCVSVFCAK
jgi:hypothetical protein